MIYRARLVLHRMQEGSHLDLFVLVPGLPVLATYELAPLQAILEVLHPEIQLVAGPQPQKAALPDPAGLKVATKTLAAARKKDHRKRYWTYEGPLVSGHLVGISYGWLMAGALTARMTLFRRIG